MARKPGGIDNDSEQIFDLEPPSSLGFVQHNDGLHSVSLPSPPPQSGDSSSMEVEFTTENIILSDDSRRSTKGKANASPMRISTSAGQSSSRHVSDNSFDAVHHYSPSSSSRITPAFVHGQDDFASWLASDGEDLGQEATSPPSLSSAKGKAVEVPPTLPPLSFSPTELGYGRVGWPSPSQLSSTPGPSSYGSHMSTSLSLFSANASQPRPHRADTIDYLQQRYEEPGLHLRRIPSRRRSLSNLSTDSVRNDAGPTALQTGVKLGPAKATSSLARRLFQSRTESGSSTPERNLSIDGPTSGPGSCFMPWKSGYKCDGAPSPYFDLDLDAIMTLDKIEAIHSRTSHPDHHANFKGKGRSYSAPITPSVFDIIPATDLDNFAPLPFVIRNLFDEYLPRELKLQVFSALVTLHEAEYEQMKKEARWTVNKATNSRYKWVGRDRGVRELVKFSRVSRAWRDLVFDGQLWIAVDLSAFPKLPASVLLRLSKSIGSFIRKIDLTGHTSLTAVTLAGVTENLVSRITPRDPFPCTRLTTINLQGCSMLDTHTLHDILGRSPFLGSVSLKGLAAVTNVTFQVLAACRLLTSLNVSRCPNIDADGLLSFCRLANSRSTLRLRELRLSGMKGICDEVLAALGRAASLLEVLDLSYCRSLHNSALEAFVACSVEDECANSVWLNAREAGRDSRDGGRYRRRITNLRHVSLSNCVMLTDIACSNLAHTMPKLEFLELAGIGPELKDEGLIRLLNTTPLIRKLDLEDAYEISNAFLAAITPSPPGDSDGTASIDSSQPGHALEHLIVSCALNLTNEAFSTLVRNCPKLRILEADGTHLSASVLRDFVRLTRSRKLRNAELVAVDCRAVGESVVREMSTSTRPRKGWRSWHARKLGYFDAQDGEELNLKPSQCQDECDETRVVLKSFFNWQTVDAVRTARERKRKLSRRLMSGDNSDGEGRRGQQTPGRTRWWSPSGRRSGTNTPGTLESSDRDGCTIM